MKIRKNWQLLPFALLYGAVTGVRNFLFDVNILKNYQPPVFSVTVGNLQVGGTGKTPHVEYLIELLRDQKVTVVSRGYGRRTKGYLKATAACTPQELGDEPFQIYQKFGDHVDVVVSENRKAGIIGLLKTSQPDVILLDDAFQHRYVHASLTVLLTTFDELFIDDCLLPVGNMREAAAGAGRADVIVVTKSPDDEATFGSVKAKVHAFVGAGIPVHFSKFTYGTPISYAKSVLFDEAAPTVTISGIAKPDYFIAHCEKHYLVLENCVFSDHFDFSRKTLEEMIKKYGDSQFITTEKDAAKIKNLLTEREETRFYYVPVKVDFFDALAFEALVLRSFKSFRAKATR